MHSSDDEIEEEKSFFDDLFKDDGQQNRKNCPLRKKIIKGFF